MELFPASEVAFSHVRNLVHVFFPIHTTEKLLSSKQNIEIIQRRAEMKHYCLEAFSKKNFSMVKNRNNNILVKMCVYPVRYAELCGSKHTRVLITSVISVSNYWVHWMG